MEAITDFVSAVVLLLNFIVVPGLSYGSQLALGALGITLVFGISAICQFRARRHHGLWHHDDNSGDLVAAIKGDQPGSIAHCPARPAGSELQRQYCC